MGRRKRKKIVYRPMRLLPKVFVCPKCGHKTMKAKMKQADDKVLIECGHCGTQQLVSKNKLTEPVDAFGDFIDIYFKDQEFERLSHRRDKLLEKEQYTELTMVLSLLHDNAMVNSEKAQEEYDKNKDPEDLDNAEKWREMAKGFNEREEYYREQIRSGILVDANIDELYDESEANPYDEGEAKISEKPKKRAKIEDILGDTGFLEF
ncbi:MAG: hypothetical protein ACTSWL_02505 [Promethearchaeota archaeon]